MNPSCYNQASCSEEVKMRPVEVLSKVLEPDANEMVYKDNLRNGLESVCSDSFDD